MEFYMQLPRVKRQILNAYSVHEQKLSLQEMAL